MRISFLKNIDNVILHNNETIFIKGSGWTTDWIAQQYFCRLIDAKSIGEEHMQEVTSFSEKKN
jgi:hypothetical protein